MVNWPCVTQRRRSDLVDENGRYGAAGRANFFFGRTFDLVSERESLLSRNPMPPHGGPGGPVGRCMGLYADVPGSNLGVGNFFFRKEFSFRI